MRALYKKCVRHSVCQRAVSARRALTGLSANHVRVKQHHVCQSANCCAVFAGKGFLSWSVFSFASCPLYFTPTQFPDSVGINVFNCLVNGNLLPIISLMPAIIPVSGHIPSTTVLHVFSDSANLLLHLVINPVLGFCLTILHVFSDSANRLLHLVLHSIIFSSCNTVSRLW